MNARGAMFAALAFAVLTIRADEAGAPSLYHLDTSWMEDNGRAFRLGDLRADAKVVVLFYTRCTGTCPATVKALQMFERAESAADKARTRYLLFTVDPEADTLVVLRDYRRTMRLPRPGWKLLRGSSRDIRKLAAILGFNYQQIEAGEFVHSNLVTVLNPRGEIVHQQNGVGGDQAALADAVHRALSDEQ